MEVCTLMSDTSNGRTFHPSNIYLPAINATASNVFSNFYFFNITLFSLECPTSNVKTTGNQFNSNLTDKGG